MAKCVNCGKGIVVIDYKDKKSIYSCNNCSYINSVVFPDGSLFEGKFKENFFPKIMKTKFEKWTGIFTDICEATSHPFKKSPPSSPRRNA